jgi:GcrA cell cycle regulator
MPENWWTDERVDELKVRWSNGETGSQICRAMKATSRNAVVGKAYRLKLQTRATNHSGQVARKSNQARKRRIKMIEQLSCCNDHMGEPIEMPEEKPLPGFINPKPLIELKECDCRWPGPGSGADLVFCAAPILNGYSYCAGHCRIAYTPHSRMPRWHR